MDAVLLALASAALFGAMTVLLRPALARGAGAEAGSLLTILAALALALVAVAVRGAWAVEGVWPFLVAGILGPGCSQLLFTLAVRDAGPSRTSVTVGTAPLFSVAIALVLLDEPVVAGVLAGAVLIVAGGVLLLGERRRPESFRAIGLAYALAATVVFAARDNLVRWLAIDTDVDPALAAAATLAAGGLTVLAWLAVLRRPVRLRDAGPFVAPGLAFGLSYLFLFEAYYRGRVTVVSPLVATESLWGVLLSALFLRRHERVGARLAAGAGLIVLGGVLIGVFR
ncbi:MAG TPA: DMT family transporter [Gaiellaceae bacterium]|nr:DMT family transporter [Gaiellaceae bacterium]